MIVRVIDLHWGGYQAQIPPNAPLLEVKQVFHLQLSRMCMTKNKAFEGKKTFVTFSKSLLSLKKQYC